MTLALHIKWTRRLKKKIYCPIRVRHNRVILSEEHSPSCIIFSFNQGMYTWGTMHWGHAICCFIIYLDNCELRGLPIETQTKGCCFIDEEVITNGYYINQVLGFYTPMMTLLPYHRHYCTGLLMSGWCNDLGFLQRNWLHFLQIGNNVWCAWCIVLWMESLVGSLTALLDVCNRKS